MAKLINLNVYDAKNMICVWNESNPNEDFRSGIALDDAMCGFMVPRHYMVGVFDDGTVKVSGIQNLSDINLVPYDVFSFIFKEFCYNVDIYAAKAFVRMELFDNDGHKSEKEAKDVVYAELLESGVKIDEEARQYLTSKKNEQH